jgi:hypothetical protein
LLYLRARQYAPGTERFITTDPSKLEANLYLYSKANPVNRVDPAGLFSVETIDKNINLARFASSDSSKDHSKWGFLALLQYAQNGDVINSGYVSVVGQGIQSEFWTTPKYIYEVNCEKIMVGYQFLDQYYRSYVDQSWEPKIWWRDTTSVDYQLSRNGPVPIHFWDGFDNDVGNYRILKDFQSE